MFHSFFNVPAFAIATRVCATLQRRQFPTNVSVHINLACFRYKIDSPYSFRFTLA